GAQGIRIPGDVLVISPSAYSHIHGAEPPNPLAWPTGAIPGGSRGYTEAVPVDKKEQDRFAHLVGCGFGHRGPSDTNDCGAPSDRTLARTYDRWFKNGEYAFTVDDVVALLRQDQENSGDKHLALVLPGGGVKAAYQSRLLDELYGGWIANAGVTDVVPSSDHHHSSLAPLRVDTVAGTSGGAMVGLFAARSRHGRKLESLWIEGEEVKTSAADIFPRLGLMRFAGLYAIIVIVQIALIIVFWFWRDPSGGIASGDPPPKRITLLLAAALLLGPFAIRRAMAAGEAHARHVQDWALLAKFGAYVPVVEALLYGLVVCLVHFTWTCCVTKEGADRKVDSWHSYFRGLGSDFSFMMRSLSSWVGVTKLWGPSMGLMLLGVAGVIVGLISGATWVRFIEVWHFRIYVTSLVEAVSAVSFVVGVTLFASGVSAKAKMVGRRDYLQAVGVLWGTLGISLLVVAVAAWRGQATLLEIAPQFWQWTIGVAVCVVAALMVLQHVLARSGRGMWLRDSLRYLANQQSFFGRQLSPIGTLLLVNGGALFLWALCVTPALYDNANALEFFRHRLEADLGREPIQFDANLVVTGSSLEPATAGDANLLPGDQYFCFDGDSRCPRQIRSLRWHNVTSNSKPLDIDDVLDPVFASGSPFPVLPDHSIDLPMFKGRLVDGGYVHNTPLQAAALTGARQVLIVNSSPREAETEILESTGVLSRLARNISRLLPFMFEQSQGTDRGVASTMTIASLAPVCDGQPFPFLADFRPEVVKRMVRCASSDLSQHRRLGRIDSWGRPRRYAHVAASVPGWEQLPTKGWSPSVVKALTTALGNAETNNTFATMDAAFDMDDTVVKNDFDEALIREFILRQSYGRGSPEFWDLVQDSSARRELQSFAGRNVCAKQSIDNSKEWSTDCQDYFVLFWKQYETNPTSSWAARLFVGQKPKDVDDLAEAVWKDEVNRPPKRMVVTSTRYGSVSLSVGVRPHVQMTSLIQLLKARHWNVWLVSEKSEYAVRVLGRKIGVAPGHALGLRSELSPDGLITGGIEKAIASGDPKVAALRDVGAIDAGRHLSLAAGDSEADVPMFQDASANGTVLVIGRGKVPADPGSRWLRQG
ncbi:MAG TPA: haloacid dehalogenase-like hydrolase, partial [Polyangia bacterium]|nr:haloacid dehalogenase-like hydrolase [Polyangia bacterium]